MVIWIIRLTTPQTTYAANARLSSAIKMLIDF